MPDSPSVITGRDVAPLEYWRFLGDSSTPPLDIYRSVNLYGGVNIPLGAIDVDYTHVKNLPLNKLLVGGFAGGIASGGGLTWDPIAGQLLAGLPGVLNLELQGSGFELADGSVDFHVFGGAGPEFIANFPGSVEMGMGPAGGGFWHVFGSGAGFEMLAAGSMSPYFNWRLAADGMRWNAGDAIQMPQAGVRLVDGLGGNATLRIYGGGDPNGIVLGNVGDLLIDSATPDLYQNIDGTNNGWRGLLHA